MSGCHSLYYYPDSRTYYDPREFSYEYESHFIPVNADQKMHYWYFPAEQKPRALVLHFHGNAQNISTHFLASAWLSNFGYDVMIFDYRGYGQSDGSPSPENTYLDGLAALKEANRIASEKGIPLVVLAQSLGGAVALRAVADSEAKPNIALLVADSTFPSYRGIVRRKARDLLFYPLSELIALFFSNSRSPEDALDRIPPVPVLVMHSRQDPVVEFANGEELFQRLEPPKFFLEVDEPGHMSWSNQGRSATDRIFLDFLDRAIKAHEETGVSPFPGE